jgi:hypothetical protein
MNTGSTHLDLNDKRVCIHLNPPQGPSYARKPNLIFRIGTPSGNKGIEKIGIDNLELLADSPPSEIMSALKIWLAKSDLGDQFKKVWGTYAGLKDGRK